MAHEEHEHRAREHDPAAPRRSRALQAPGEQHRDEHRGEAAEARVEPRGPVALAEDFVARRGGPVLKRRLFDVYEAVEMRDHPVAAREHFAWDLGVAALVG